jgi:hypothetical protein
MMRTRSVFLGLLALAVAGAVLLLLVLGGEKRGSSEPRAIAESHPATSSSETLENVHDGAATAGSREPSAAEHAAATDRACELPVLVEDRATGLPLQDVPLELRTSTPEGLHAGTSRADGRCRFADLEPGEYTLKSGSSADLEYAADPTPVTLTSGAHEEIVLRVERRWFLAGVVVEKSSESPIPGVSLMAQEHDGKRTRVGTSGEEGRFRSRNSYAAGTLSLSLSEHETQGLMRTSGPGPDLLQVDVGRGDLTHLRVELDWVGVLKGVVLDLRDHPIAGAELRVLSGDSIYLENASLRYWGLYEGMRSEGRVGRSDAQGRFGFARLPNDRTLVIVASASGFASGRSADLSPPFLASGEPVVLHLDAGGSIAGTVRDAQGEAMAEVQITALSANTHYQPDPTRTDAQGAYRLSGLKPGATEVAALAQEKGALPHAVAGGKVEVITGQEARLDLRVGADGVHLSGTAVDQDGQVLTGNRVHLSLRTIPIEPRPGETTWGFDTPLQDDGTFDVTVPREGSYRLALLSMMAGDPWEFQDVQAPAHDLRLRFTVAPTGELKVRALDAATGESIDQGDVSIAWDRGSLGGNFFGGGLSWTVREGVYTLTVDAKGYAPASREVDLRGKMQPRTLVEVRLDRGRPVSGIVRDAEGRPVKGCTIVLRFGGQLQLQNLVYSGVDGRFAIASAPTTGGSVCVIDESYKTLAVAEISAGDVALTIGVK